jgi:3-deoxy-manno-octulosonate cytidylyltransferase (CMP-KDO synthetase)
MSKSIAVIPVRYESIRLPGKPLLEIGGKSMLQRVYERVKEAYELDRIIIATDDERIESHARDLGAEVEMTFRSHRSGTDRCAQVARQFWSEDIVINVQGDEPFIDPASIDQMVRSMREDDWIGICSMYTPLLDEKSALDPSVVKVLRNLKGNALYFSRQILPFYRDKDQTVKGWKKHIGLYGFRNKVLQEISSLPPSELELAEQLEQLRWLENGYDIFMLPSAQDSYSVDTPEDLELARKMVDF